MAESTTRDTRPVPDPTALTTEALRRDNHALRELLEAKQQTLALRTEYEAKLSVLRHEFTDKRFSYVAAQTAQISEMNQKALDAALMTAREVTNGLRDMLNVIKERQDRGEGKDSGARDVWGWVFGALGLLVAVGIAVFKH